MQETFIQHGSQFIDQIFLLIVEETRKELDELYTIFEERVVSRLLRADSNTSSKMELFEQTKAELPELQKKIEPIKIKYKYLKDNNEKDAHLTPEEHQRIKDLPEAWKQFNDDLFAADEIIKKSKQTQGRDVERTMEDFKREVELHLKHSLNSAPFTVGVKTDNDKAKTERVQACLQGAASSKLKSSV